MTPSTDTLRTILSYLIKMGSPMSVMRYDQLVTTMYSEYIGLKATELLEIFLDSGYMILTDFDDTGNRKCIVTQAGLDWAQEEVVFPEITTNSFQN